MKLTPEEKARRKDVINCLHESLKNEGEASFYKDLTEVLVHEAKEMCVRYVQYILLSNKIAKGKLGKDIEAAMLIAKADELNYVTRVYSLFKVLDREFLGDGQEDEET